MTTLEKAARALYDSMGATGMDMQCLALQYGRIFVDGDFDAAAAARAVLEAIREPDEGMIEAAVAESPDVRDIWQAMIDQILKCRRCAERRNSQAGA